MLVQENGERYRYFFGCMNLRKRDRKKKQINEKRKGDTWSDKKKELKIKIKERKTQNETNRIK